MGVAYVVWNVIFWTIRILTWIIIIDAVLTWFPSVSRYHPVVIALRQITEPIYKPIRKLVPPGTTGHVDISPLIAIIALYVIGSVLQRIILG